MLNCFCVTKGEAELRALLLAHFAPSPSRDFRAGIAPLLLLSSLRQLLPARTLPGGWGKNLTKVPVKKTQDIP
ncbi:hypothetical protein AYI68_g1767 [Smittium mucronatum]|uniref:Uncharacterized protein n=1 Tax=Smittium mucronatum TaxID=133383 RepID=A0A1R0H4G0_9FUNG|nr:hypothetical protein AYI68_g1767 [Smittium mucronatum]